MSLEKWWNVSVRYKGKLFLSLPLCDELFMILYDQACKTRGVSPTCYECNGTTGIFLFLNDDRDVKFGSFFLLTKSLVHFFFDGKKFGSFLKCTINYCRGRISDILLFIITWQIRSSVMFFLKENSSTLFMTNYVDYGCQRAFDIFNYSSRKALIMVDGHVCDELWSDGEVRTYPMGKTRGQDVWCGLWRIDFLRYKVGSQQRTFTMHGFVWDV